MTATADAALPYNFAEADRSIPRMLLARAASLTTAPLFECAGEAWTYAETAEIAARTAGALAEAGIKPGDRVTILSRNRPEVMRLLLGAAWLGAIAVPLNSAWRGPQICHALLNSGARLLAGEADLLAGLSDDVLAASALERVWTFGASTLPLPGSLPCTSMPAHTEALPPANIDPGAPFAILYTSGTTGLSKGVICPHAQFYWWAAFTCRFLEIRPGDVLATTLPLFHTNAINTFFQALLSGSKQVVERRFSVSNFWSDMRASGATVSYLLGAMVPMLLTRQPGDSERHHSIRTMLAPGVPPALYRSFHARTGITAVDGFGSTETNFVIGAMAPARVDGQIGWTSPGVSARIADAEGADADTGELLLRTKLPYAFSSGYFGDVAKTAEAWRDGWFHTGDRVRREKNGAYVFVDRIKDSIRRRGENISAFEVEAALLQHPGIAEAAVFGVASDMAEEEVMAVVVLNEPAHLSAGDVHAHCASLLPAFAVPRYIEFATGLPKTENGKIAKPELKQRGVSGATWDETRARIPIALRQDFVRLV